MNSSDFSIIGFDGISMFLSVAIPDTEITEMIINITMLIVAIVVNAPIFITIFE